MSTFYTTFLSKSDYSFVLLLVTFEPLEVEQSYVPLLKALMCGINALGPQGCSCMSTFCHALQKIALLLHKMANGPYSFLETVYHSSIFKRFPRRKRTKEKGQINLELTDLHVWKNQLIQNRKNNAIFIKIHKIYFPIWKFLFLFDWMLFGKILRGFQS